MCEGHARGRRALLGTGFALAPLPVLAQAPRIGESPPELALRRLLDGNLRHAANRAAPRERGARPLPAPIAAVLACADARVTPEVAFDQPPGALFVVQLAGNLAGVDAVAGFDFAVSALGVPLLVVLGHSGCVTVQAALRAATEAAPPDDLAALRGAILPAARDAQSLEETIAGNVRRQVERLRDAEPLLARARRERRLDVVGAVYNAASGRVALV